MCNLLFTYELARRLEETGVTVNAYHPGRVKTDLMREAPLVIRSFSQLRATTPEKAAAGLVYLASSSDVSGTMGKFFKGQEIIESNPYSYAPKVQSRLWDIGVALTERA